MTIINHLIKIQKIINTINEWIGRSVAWLTLSMIILTTIIVILRYVFNTGSIALQESVNYMHASVFLLGIAYTLKHDGHVRVDIFYQKFSKKTKAWIDLLGTLILLMPSSMFIIWVSFNYVEKSWSIFEGSRETGGLDGVFLIKTLIIIMPILLIMQGISFMIQSLLTIIKNDN